MHHCTSHISNKSIFPVSCDSCYWKFITVCLWNHKNKEVKPISVKHYGLHLNCSTSNCIVFAHFKCKHERESANIDHKSAARDDNHTQVFSVLSGHPLSKRVSLRGQSNVLDLNSNLTVANALPVTKERKGFTLKFMRRINV